MQLALPASYVEEMVYLDGGKSVIGLPGAVETIIFTAIRGALGTIMGTGKVPAYMVKAAVSSVKWIKWAFTAARVALKANPFAAGVIVGGLL